jgi:hypothetical protein
MVLHLGICIYEFAVIPSRRVPISCRAGKVDRVEVTGETKECARLVELIKQDEAKIARVQARQLERIAKLAKLEGRGRGVNAEVAFALRLTENAASKRVSLACALTTRLPETLNAMRRGEIDSYKASKIAGPTEVLTEEHAREVDLIMSTRWHDKTRTRSGERSIASSPRWTRTATNKDAEYGGRTGMWR